MTTILALLNAIIALPGLIQQLIGYFEKLEKAHWLNEKAEAFEVLKKAESQEDFFKAAKDIQQLLRKL